MSTQRFIIEGEWSGYVSRQQHVVHRQVFNGSYKQLRAWAEKTYAIRYTDGTCLILRVRDCKPREKVREILGYRSLIADCAYHDVDSVEALQRAQNAAKKPPAAEAA